MSNPSGVPAFGGYFTRRVGVNTEHLYAYWADGSLAYEHYESGVWSRCDAPDFAALFPDRVTREPERTWMSTTPEEIQEMSRVAMRFRSDLPAQPRPDDADDREYPARGGRDD